MLLDWQTRWSSFGHHCWRVGCFGGGPPSLPRRLILCCATKLASKPNYSLWCWIDCWRRDKRRWVDMLFKRVRSWCFTTPLDTQTYCCQTENMHDWLDQFIDCNARVVCHLRPCMAIVLSFTIVILHFYSINQKAVAGGHGTIDTGGATGVCCECWACSSNCCWSRSGRCWSRCGRSEWACVRGGKHHLL